MVERDRPRIRLLGRAQMSEGRIPSTNTGPEDPDSNGGGGDPEQNVFTQNGQVGAA
jgi:hypothetical protein